MRLRHLGRVSALAVALLAATLLAPAPPASAAAVEYVWSTLADGQHLTFDPEVDVLKIDTAIPASQVRLVQGATDLAVSAGGKTIHLDGLRLGQLRLQAFWFAGVPGSVLVVGDGSYVEWDTDGRILSTTAPGVAPSQLISLGGPTIYRGTPFDDRFVGAPAIRPLTHLSRTAGAGSPTPTHLPSITATGTKVAFEGGWTGFGSTSNSATDIIVRNVDAGTFTQEHRSLSGSPGLSGSGAPSISADGSTVAFVSSSQLLGTSTPSNTIFRADTTSNAIVAASTSSTGTLANGSSDEPDLSADGNYVAFLSVATNLATGSSATTEDVFVKDVGTGTTTRISTSQTGGDADADATRPRISDNGRYVTFASAATNLTTTETGGGASDIYLWDRSGGSLTNLTAAGPGTGSSRNPDVADDGTVAFETDKALVAADTDAFGDVYTLRPGNAAKLVSQTATGGQVALASSEPAISARGRWVAFRSFSDQLVPGDTNGVSDVFAVDTATKEIALVSRTATAQANQASSRPAISGDGLHIAFESGASNLSALDGNGTGSDVFVVGNPTVHSTLEGLAGNDRYVLDAAGFDTVVEAAAGGTDTVEARVTGTYALPSEVENFVGTAGADRVRGNASNNRIDPGLGNDLMYDTAGNDTYVIDVNTDNLTTDPGAGGTDTIETPTTWTLQSFLENLTLTGSAAVNGTGNNANNVLTGNGANNVLDGAGGTDTYTGGGGADAYYITSSANVDVVADFAVGTDKFRMRQSAWRIGDGDLLVEGATNRTGPGGFSSSAEYVVISKNLTSITMTNASAAIGSASSPYAVGARRVFMVDNGTSSQLLLFIAANADAKVSASELKPLMTFRNRNAMSVRDLQFVA